MASQHSPTGPLAPQPQHYPPPPRPPLNGGMPMPPPPPQQQQQPPPPPQLQQPQQQQPPPPPPQQQQQPPPQQPPQQHGRPSTVQMIAQANEGVWLQLGALSEQMGELDSATQAYERAMSFNQWSVPAMLAISCILRSKDQFTSAVEYLRQIIKLEPSNGEVWSSLGHCYLMMDDLQQAYSAYQQALYHLPDPKEPKLWYGIGILYDRYGSLEHAEEAFSQVMRMEPGFEKANEIYFRLGIIYKQQQKFQQSLECFRYIVNDPPRPLSEEDIWFQIGHVHEQQKDYDSAKAAYTRVLERDPNHAKVLQQLGWLHHQQSTSFNSQEQAIEYLEKSVNSDQTDAQSWYLLGRCYMSQQKYPKAYEAYQQAVYRDGRNPTFWCSIGVLYYQINQYRDALDAYSRAIRLNPNISEVWYDLGTLYESCNNQTSDALDAYTRAADLDPTNGHIKARLALLKGQSTAGLPSQSGQPVPQDVNPQAYQPGTLGSGPPGPQWHGQASNPPPIGPAPPPLLQSANNWGGNRLADLQNPAMAPQAINPYDQRDRMPPNAPQGPPRQQSPRQEVPRYQEQPQRPLPPSHRGLSPSPKIHQAATAPFQSAPLQQPPMQAQQQQQQQQGPPPHEMPRLPFGAPINGSQSNGHGSAAQTPLQMYPREAPPDIRPLGTPGGGSYQPRPFENVNHPPNIASGAPPPTSAQTAADVAARERDDRPPSAGAHKRGRDWDDDHRSVKKPTTDDSRARLDEIKLQPPDQKMTPPPNRSPSEMRRLDEARPTSAYRPSDAAHHPPLPPMGSLMQPSPRASAPPQAEHRAPPPPPAPPALQPPPPPSQQQPPQPRQPTPVQATPAPAPVFEPAARKIEVDENYDESGDERSVTKQESQRSSPRALNGSSNVTSSSVIEQQA